MTAKEDGPIRIAVVADVTWAGPLLSLTVIVKVEDPLVVAVPKIVPVDGDNVTPIGNRPEVIDHA